MINEEFEKYVLNSIVPLYLGKEYIKGKKLLSR